MSDRPRNLIVGLTMIVALGLLMYGIILLGKFPSFGAIGPYTVTLFAEDANGIQDGARVEFKGVYAGQVKSVSLDQHPPGKIAAKIVLQIDHYINIPKTTKATLNKPQAVGQSTVKLEAEKMEGPMLPHDGSAVLEAAASDNGLIPKEVFDDLRDLKTQLSTVAGDLHTLLVYAPPEEVEKADPNDPKRLRPNVSTVIVRLNRLVDSVQKLLGDPQLQTNVREAVQNIADASAQLKTTLKKIDDAVGGAGTVVGQIGAAATQASATLSTTERQISNVAQKLVETLNDIQKVTRQISEGNGTAGKLVTDPRLYEGLVDLSKSLKSTSDDLDFLIQKWKDEGVNFHMGK